MAGEKGVAIVTGGTRGIGGAITRQLQADGFAVAAFYQNNDIAAKECETRTGARTFKVDVSDLGDCSWAYETVTAQMGPVVALVNNAGITRDAMLHKMDVEIWDEVLRTNLNSCFYMSRAVIGGMRERGYGRIVNIASINGQKGQAGQTNYAAAKAGMIGFTKALALESAGKGITVNAVCPGYVETHMTASMPPAALEAILRQIPVGRLGQAAEIAALVALLVSEQAAFITGATLAANGGQYMG